MDKLNIQDFNSDFYNGLIDKEENPEIVDAVFEDITDAPEPLPIMDDPFQDGDDCKKFVSSVKKTNIDKKLKGSIPSKLPDQPDNTQVAKVFGDLFEDLNKTYGLEVKFDFNSFSNTLSYLINPKTQAAAEVYISAAYSRIRSSLYILYLNAITMLSTQILDPKFITSNSMSYSDKLILMRELFQYIQSLNSIYKDVQVKDSDLKLKKLSENDNPDYSLETKEVQEFLEKLANSVTDKNKKPPTD